MSWFSMDDAAPRRELSPEEQDSIEDVLLAAEAWAAGDLPFYEAAGIGTIGTPARTRYLAVSATPKSDPRRRMLLDLIDVLIAKQGFVVTRQGCFTRFDIRESEAQVAYAFPNGVPSFGEAA